MNEAQEKQQQQRTYEIKKRSVKKERKKRSEPNIFI